MTEGQERHFEDVGIALDVEKDAGPQPVNHGYVIATCALSQTGWTSFHPGELIVLEGGTLCFSSRAEPIAERLLDRSGMARSEALRRASALIDEGIRFGNRHASIEDSGCATQPQMQGLRILFGSDLSEERFKVVIVPAGLLAFAAQAS